MKPGLLISAGLLVLSPLSASAFGTISMSSTGYPDSVVVEVTVIYDDGSAPECAWLAVTRDGLDVFYFERAPGNSQTVSFTDTGVMPNSSYCYEMALRLVPGFPCPLGDLCQYFDCFCYIGTCANTGPEPTFIGVGYLSTHYPDGSPIDNNETRALLYSCTSSTEFIDLHSIPLEAEQYLDTDTSVKVSGGYWCCWAQCVWLLSADEVVPESCAISTRETTWGRVKALYRE